MEQASQFVVDVPDLVAIGTYAATNGSDQLVGSGTKVTAGQRLFLTNSAGFIGIVGSDNNGGNILLAAPWGGVTGSGTLYATSSTISEEVEEFYTRTNQVGTLAQRATYNAQAEGYVYLVVDAPATFYGRFGPSGTWFNVATNSFIYVDVTLGDDVNGTGDIDLPVQTINAAIAIAQAADDMTGQTLYIVIKAGTYNQQVSFQDIKGALLGAKLIAWQSLAGTHALTSYTVTFAGDTIRSIRNKTVWEVIGISVGSTKGHCLLAKAAHLRFNQLRFLAASGSHISSLGGGTISLNGDGYTIAGGANAHLNANGSGAVIDLQAEAVAKPTITLPTSPTTVAFAAAFAWARASGQIFTGTGLIFVNKGQCTATTKRWRAEQNSSIDSGQSGERYLPGGAAGIAVKSGEYI